MDPRRRALLVLAAGVAAVVVGVAGLIRHHHDERSTPPSPPHHEPHTPPAPHAPHAITPFGTDVGPIFQSHPYDRAYADRQLTAARAAGLGLARSTLLWEFAEPRAPVNGRHVYDWRYDDFMARELRAHHLGWVAVLAFAPGWASRDPAVLHGAPRRDADFAAYARAVARRYHGQIVAYEIWNEENSPTFWRPRPDPAAYADLYRAAKSAIHAADPGPPVLVGGLTDGAGPYLEAMFHARPALRGHVDGVSVHPYGRTPGEVVNHVRAWREVLDAAGGTDVPLWVTEYGWSSAPPGNDKYAPPNLRPGYLADTSATLLRSDCDIAAVTFYAWTTAEQSPANGDDWLGIAPPDAASTPETRAVASVAREAAAGRLPLRRVCG